MTQQSCGGSPARSQSCRGGPVRQGSKVPAKVAKEPTAKRARKQAPTQGLAEELISPLALTVLKKSGVTKASLEPVLEVVMHVRSGLPKEARDMLLVAIPWSLATPADKRHESQQDVVRMVDGVFGTVQAELQRVVDAETSKVDELKAWQAELADTSEQAEAASGAARSVVEEQEKALAQASSTLVQAREALHAAEREEARLGAEASQTRSLMLDLEETMSGSFRRLKNVEFEDGELDGLVQNVMAAGAKVCLEEALVTTLAVCLAKRERGAFDRTVIGEAEKCIQRKIAALGEVLEAAAGPVEAHAEAAREARAALDAAAADEAQAADRLHGAQAESTEAVATAEAAKVAAAEFDAELAPALEAQGARQGELDLFRSYNVSLFGQLRDRMTETDVANEPEGSVAGVGPLAALAGA